MTVHRLTAPLGLALASLLPACSTYTVRKSALAPHIAPPMRNGQGMGDASSEAAFGASTLASAGAPEEGEDANAGLYIPRVELQGALRARLRNNFDLGFLWDHGFRQGAYATSEDQPSPDNGSVYGGGLTTFYSIPTGAPEFRIGVGFDFMMYSVPYVEYRTCVTNCGGVNYTEVDHDRESVGVVSLAVIPSFRTGRWTFFGGGTLRNHPTIDKGSIEVGFETDDDVESGPGVLVAHVGAEMELGAGLRAMAMVYQPLDTDPVKYMPTFGLGLAIPLGRHRPPPPPPPPPAAPYTSPPVYGPQPAYPPGPAAPPPPVYPPGPPPPIVSPPPPSSPAPVDPYNPQ